MYTVQGSDLRYSIDDNGCVSSIYNKLTKHEYVKLPGELWKLIYSEGEAVERPVFSRGQSFTAEVATDDVGREYMVLTYDRPHSDDRTVDVTLRLRFTAAPDGLSVTAELENRDASTIHELSVTAFSGISSLSGVPQQDALMFPMSMGQRIPAPSLSDLSVYAGFRKYERHDYIHTDVDKLYPGSASMQWYDLYNDGEGIYVGSHDATGATVCLHVERDVKTNVLGLGMIRYPFAETGESWKSEPIFYAVHEGDWHAGSRLYRRWIESAGYRPPQHPEWIKNFEGWLRVILKPHHCEINWDYSKIPELFDEAKAAGLDTIFLLGWERGGFARRWPDYYLDERMGGEQKLREGIEYVHSQGGKVAMFLSYYLIDHRSEFYLKEGGDKCTIKSIWGEDIPFAETYCGEGTYRKIGNPPMPMYAACPGAPLWQEKMLKSAEYILDLGADAVLYDIGGHTPFFCFDKSHTHAKPSLSHERKARNYRELREYIKGRNPENAIFMEHTVDIFGEHMDLAHSGGVNPRSQALKPEMYRYTFPEHNATNREMGRDEDNYKDNINYTFLYGLAFDMTIYRCCGTLSDIPLYTAYMSKIIALRKRYAKYLHGGRFTDNEGFTLDNPEISGKSYRAPDGALGVALWNRSHAAQKVILKGENDTRELTVEADGVAFAELG